MFRERVDSQILGIGMTLGFGYQNVFASVDIMYVNSVTDWVDVDMDALAITPAIGYTVNSWRTRFLVGGQYQDYDLLIKGNLPGLGDFEVGQSLDKWTYVFGAQ